MHEALIAIGYVLLFQAALIAAGMVCLFLVLFWDKHWRRRIRGRTMRGHGLGGSDCR